MNTYIATASNRYFWQELAVKAKSRETAERKFRKFLANRASRANEKYEWSEGDKLYPDDRAPISHYRYDIDERKIECVDECDSRLACHPVSIAVTMIDSGGNG